MTFNSPIAVSLITSAKPTSPRSNSLSPAEHGTSKIRWIAGLRRSASMSRVLRPLRARLVAR